MLFLLTCIFIKSVYYQQANFFPTLFLQFLIFCLISLHTFIRSVINPCVSSVLLAAFQCSCFTPHHISMMPLFCYLQTLSLLFLFRTFLSCQFRYIPLSLFPRILRCNKMNYYNLTNLVTDMNNK